MPSLTTTPTAALPSLKVSVPPMESGMFLSESSRRASSHAPALPVTFPSTRCMAAGSMAASSAGFTALCCGMASMVSSPRARITDNMMMLLRFIV